MTTDPHHRPRRNPSHRPVPRPIPRQVPRPGHRHPNRRADATPAGRAEHTAAEHTAAEHTAAEHTTAEHTTAEHTTAGALGASGEESSWPELEALIWRRRRAALDGAGAWARGLLAHMFALGVLACVIGVTGLGVLTLLDRAGLTSHQHQAAAAAGMSGPATPTRAAPRVRLAAYSTPTAPSTLTPPSTVAPAPAVHPEEARVPAASGCSSVPAGGDGSAYDVAAGPVHVRIGGIDLLTAAGDRRCPRGGARNSGARNGGAWNGGAWDNTGPSAWNDSAWNGGARDGAYSGDYDGCGRCGHRFSDSAKPHHTNGDNGPGRDGRGGYCTCRTPAGPDGYAPGYGPWPGGAPGSYRQDGSYPGHPAAYQPGGYQGGGYQGGYGSGGYRAYPGGYYPPNGYPSPNADPGGAGSDRCRVFAPGQAQALPSGAVVCLPPPAPGAGYSANGW